MKLYEYVNRNKATNQFYRVKVGEVMNLNHTDKSYSVCVDTWNLPISPANYIVIDSNPIICNHILRCGNEAHKNLSSKKHQEESFLLDTILVKIVEHQSKK